ncbi:MAG: Ribosomal RNA small subunit methyltransferase A [Microgenomates bacterium OLB23]|nr:MAG: Ribosomal RNA small subunit methyltransferase A [Microgenomates bacterium OLB23]
MIALVYYGFVVCLLLYLMVAFLYLCMLIISGLIGSPYVKTNKNIVPTIFDRANIRKQSLVVEVGSGIGVLTNTVAKRYGCRVLGIEMNPLLYTASIARNKLFGSPRVKFELKNALIYDYSPASHIYVFMFPSLIKRLAPQIRRTAKNGAMVISYGFCIDMFKDNLIHKEHTAPYAIYYYKL